MSGENEYILDLNPVVATLQCHSKICQHKWWSFMCPSKKSVIVSNNYHSFTKTYCMFLYYVSCFDVFFCDSLSLDDIIKQHTVLN